MTKPELYNAVFRHEYGVDFFTFCFVPKGKLKYPSPRKVAEHFKIDFEPGNGETFELFPAYRLQMETLSAEQIGRVTEAPADWWDDNQEGWGDENTEDTEDTDDDTESNIPCVACGRKDLPLHINRRCGACGPGPTTDSKITAEHEIRLPCYGIMIRLDREPTSEMSSCGRITSNLKDATNAAARSSNAAIDGLESLILAHACAGIDVTLPAYIEGIETTVAAIENQCDY